MSLDYGKGSAWAVRELMKLAAEDIDAGGEIRPAKVKWKTPHPRKVLIGAFAARLLRGEFRNRKEA